VIAAIATRLHPPTARELGRVIPSPGDQFG
jgi:hypothetical protein